MDYTPEPASGRAHKSLSKVAAHELKKQASALDQISQKKAAWQVSGQAAS